MSTVLIVGLVFIVGVFLFIGYFISIYNGIVRLTNGYKNSFSQIDVQLQRRYELIPNLVETAKKYMSHEKETLEAVILARNQAHSAAQALKADPSNAGAAKNFNKSEGALGASMGSFMALFENYPDLKANENMKALMEELTSTENKVSFSRQNYNDSVMTYNNGIQEFPNTIIAGMFNFKDVSQLEIEDVKMRKAVKVEF
jgi:LemA protein